MMNLNQKDFKDFNGFAKGLVGKQVEVITREGTYTGTLLSVGSDSLILETSVRGRNVRLAIRMALIVAISRYVTSSRGRPFWAQSPPQRDESSENNESHTS